MERPPEQGLSGQETASRTSCGRSGCACALPISERFVLWAMRQWRVDGRLPVEGSPLHAGFKAAGLLGALPDFAIAMDAFQFGARRSMHIHVPTCSDVSHDEATLLALCGLAQSRCDGPLTASLEVLMAPTASRVAAFRLKTFTVALARAGLHLSPLPAEASGRLH